MCLRSTAGLCADAASIVPTRAQINPLLAAPNWICAEIGDAVNAAGAGGGGGVERTESMVNLLGEADFGLQCFRE